MGLATAILSAPLALDGESAGNGSTGLAVISVVSVVVGYLVLAALWYFVFRDTSRAKRDKDSPD
jgi:hypothetical protein